MTITTIQAPNVPRPPKTAVSGISTPAIRTSPRGFHLRSMPAWRRRIHSTATWAIVNESIAPNEYIVASRSACPGSSAIEAMIEKVMIATWGVRYFGWTCRSRSGSWRC